MSGEWTLWYWESYERMLLISTYPLFLEPSFQDVGIHASYVLPVKCIRVSYNSVPLLFLFLYPYCCSKNYYYHATSSEETLSRFQISWFSLSILVFRTITKSSHYHNNQPSPSIHVYHSQSDSQDYDAPSNGCKNYKGPSSSRPFNPCIRWNSNNFWKEKALHWLDW